MSWQQPPPPPSSQPPPPSPQGYPPPPAAPGWPTQQQPPEGWSPYGAPIPQGPPYSSWGKRVAAFLIDFLVVAVPLGIVNSIVAGNLVQSDSNSFRIHVGTTGLASTLVLTLIGWGYYVILEGGARGQTVGKMALRIAVRDASGGGPIGYGRALLRRVVATILWYLLILPGLLDMLSPLWDGRRQTWHDKAVRSVVVDVA